MTYVNREVPRFAGPKMVNSTEEYKLPDMFPVSPLIDLNKEHIWRDENITGKHGILLQRSHHCHSSFFPLLGNHCHFSALDSA